MIAVVGFAKLLPDSLQLLNALVPKSILQRKTLYLMKFLLV
jgi:hypothetical protein